MDYVVSYRLSLVLDHVPPSLNSALSKSWQQRYRIRSALGHEIYLRTRGLTPPEPLKQAKLRFVRHSAGTLDFDGLVGGLKPVVDALKSAGIIADDGWGYVGAWEVDQVQTHRKYGSKLEIHVSEVV